MRPFHLRTMVLVLLALTCASAPALAEGRPYRITALGGMTVTSLGNADDPLGILQSMKGFAAGAGFSWRLATSLELQPELLYVQKGVSMGEGEGTDPFGNPTGSYEVLLVAESIEVPLLLQWEIPTGGRFHPVLLGGPFVCFELGEQMKFTGSDQFSELSHDTSFLNDTDYGIALGAGLELDAGRGRWMLQGRYDAGLADLGDFTGSGNGHSRAWLFMTGYRF